ncbi:hypothetical protein DY000_02024115 [Brassica cretica]|uniref:Uncharacterized protein n=1 Tax=Brassica cretica TaxID=69181 RepID=A0ABQ7E817_BRACR|nr:hypothetical protein DY000_02024115 [Brassica cretica]
MESSVFHKTLAIIIEEGAGHLSYWCDLEGEDGHDCSMQKTIMLKDGRYGQWKVHMKLLVRGINDDAWIAVKTGWEDPTIFTAEGNKLKPKEPRQGVAREMVLISWGEKSISMYEDEDNASLVGENGIPSVEVSRWGNVVAEPEECCA